MLVLQRVSTLLRDNRFYRRQALQAQLAVLHDTGAGMPAVQQQQQQQLANLPVPGVSVPVHKDQGSPLASQQQQQQPEGRLAMVSAPGGAACTPKELHQQQQQQVVSCELQRLQDELAAAEQHLALLSEENERLMELSNSLRAENERLKVLQVTCGARGCQSGWASCHNSLIEPGMQAKRWHGEFRQASVLYSTGKSMQCPWQYEQPQRRAQSSLWGLFTL